MSNKIIFGADLNELKISGNLYATLKSSIESKKSIVGGINYDYN